MSLNEKVPFDATNEKIYRFTNIIGHFVKTNTHKHHYYTFLY